MTHTTIEAVATRIGVINASEDYSWHDEAVAAGRLLNGREHNDLPRQA